MVLYHTCRVCTPCSSSGIVVSSVPLLRQHAAVALQLRDLSGQLLCLLRLLSMLSCLLTELSADLLQAGFTGLLCLSPTHLLTYIWQTCLFHSFISILNVC